MAATDEAEGRVAAAAEQQEEMAQEAKQLGRQLTELEEENLGLRSRIRALTEAAEAKDKQIKQLEREVAAKVQSGKMAVLAVQADADQAAAGFRLELQELQGQLRRATEQAGDSDAELASLRKERDAATAALEESRQRVAGLEAEAAARAAEFEAQSAELVARCEEAEASERELGDEIKRLQEETIHMAELRMERDSALLEKEAAEHALDEVSADLI